MDLLQVVPEEGRRRDEEKDNDPRSRTSMIKYCVIEHLRTDDFQLLLISADDVAVHLLYCFVVFIRE